MTHLLAAAAGFALGVICMCLMCMSAAQRDDFQTTSDWEPDPLPPLNDSALADLGRR